MNKALAEFLANGGQITQLPSGVPSDTNSCMNCKGQFPTEPLTLQGTIRRCRKCVERRNNFRSKR